MRLRGWVVGCGVAFAVAGCSSPTAPPTPPVVDPSSAPLIQSITVPTSRVEAGQNIAISAEVVDAETPLTQLAYAWTASAGTITGMGATATWTHPAGITSGVDVTVTLTVTDTYDAVENNQVVKKQYVVSRTSSSFRVHDSTAELLFLSRRFLRDLFGNSAVPPADCLVDFTDLCADHDFGKGQELDDIIKHRTLVVVEGVTFFSETVSFDGPDRGQVYSDAEFIDRWLIDNVVRPYRNEYVITGRYHQGRWWICESFVDRSNDVMRDGRAGLGGRGRIGERIR